MDIAPHLGRRGAMMASDSDGDDGNIIDLDEATRRLDEEKRKKAQADGLPAFFQASEFKGISPPARGWAVPGYVPRRVPTLFSGHGGMGKTNLLADLLISKASGQNWLQIPLDPAPCLGIFGEEERGELHRKVAAICGARFIDEAMLDTLSLVSLAESDYVLAEPSARNPDKLHPTILYNHIVAQAKDLSVRLVVLDPAADLFGGNEINRSHVRQFLAMLRKLAIDIDGGVILAMHPSREGLRTDSGYSGSTAWHNSVRSLLLLTTPADDEAEIAAEPARLLRHLKCNIGPLQPDLPLRWDNGIFWPEGLEMPGGIMGKIDRNNLKKAFLETLHVLVRRGVNLSANPTANNYAPTIMMRERMLGRASRRQIAAAMADLFEDGEIVTEQYGRPSDRRTRIVPEKKKDTENEF